MFSIVRNIVGKQAIEINNMDLAVVNDAFVSRALVLELPSREVGDG